MRALVWFRSDLRVHDNTALHYACHACHASRAAGGDSGAGVVGLFIIVPGQWRRHDYAPARVDLILRTLRELSADLARLNIPLLIARARDIADVPAVVLETARRHACASLHFNREYELDEARRDAAVIAEFERAGLVARGHTDQVCFEPGSVRTGEGRYYTVFTPFKKACIAHHERAGGLKVWPAPPRQARTGLEPTPVPGHIEGFRSAIPGDLWPGGEAHAMARLSAFIETAIRRYKEDRDYPAEAGTSRLSPYLAVGAISPRQCIRAALEANDQRRPGLSPLEHGPAGIVHWISEVLWREFYIHITAGFPRVCMGRAFQPATERLRWSDNEEHLEAWKQGRTGVPIVDAGMRQLLSEGWMHNRVRMITAMYLTKNLFIDWRRGEKWFMQNLVDGFFACNNGGWQWSASTGTDASPYFRIFNPVSQSKKFDADAGYIRKHVPELAGIDGPAIHEPWTLPGLPRARLDYPEPLVDLSSSRERAIDAFKAIRMA
ncbi:MAG: deoxyribodipyrimidine photo-lyase [Phycisphaerales bacterium]|nr:deoxyribodipyrimidine photo-lyase [Phycisphaerales bacterium]